MPDLFIKGLKYYVLDCCVKYSMRDLYCDVISN